MSDKPRRGRPDPVPFTRQPEKTMSIDRLAGFAPRTRALASDLAVLQGPCVGCTDCEGLCRELIEALVLPDVVLGKGRKT